MSTEQQEKKELAEKILFMTDISRDLMTILALLIAPSVLTSMREVIDSLNKETDVDELSSFIGGSIKECEQSIITFMAESFSLDDLQTLLRLLEENPILKSFFVFNSMGNPLQELSSKLVEEFEIKLRAYINQKAQKLDMQ